MAASSDSGVLEELEVLEAIYMDDLNITKDDSGLLEGMSLVLHPATGDDVHKKFVCMTLVIQIPKQYPNDLPTVTVRNPRGIGDEDIQSLLKVIDKRMEERKGESVLFEIIELAKESLTEGNIPQCPCVICMEHFQEGNSFTKTQCYHYFHHRCLARYIHHCQEAQKQEVKKITLHMEKEEMKVQCPVCREEITYELLNLEKHLNQMECEEEEINVQPSEELRKWQQDMNAIWQRQTERGGIIDVEANRNKFLLTEDDMRIMLPLQREPKEDRERKDTETESIRTGREASDGHRGRGRRTERRRHGDRDRDREDFGHRAYRGAGWNAGAHTSGRGRGRYFRVDNEKYERNKGNKSDGREKSGRKEDNVDKGVHRTKKDNEENNVQLKLSQTKKQDSHSLGMGDHKKQDSHSLGMGDHQKQDSHSLGIGDHQKQDSHSLGMGDHQKQEMLSCEKYEVNGLKGENGVAQAYDKNGGDRRGLDGFNLHEDSVMDSRGQGDNNGRSRGSRDEGELDRKRKDLDRYESEVETSRNLGGHENGIKNQQDHRRNNGEIKDSEKENITINCERGEPLLGPEIHAKDISPLEHERKDKEKIHSGQSNNIKDRPYSGFGRYGKQGLYSEYIREKNRPHSGYSRGSKNRPVARDVINKPLSGDSKGRPESEDSNRRPVPADSKERHASGDGEKKSSSGDGKDRPASRDGNQRPASGESDVNANRPRSQHNSTNKNRPSAKFGRVQKGRPLAESADGKERPTLGDGEKGPSSGDGKERPTLGDGEKGPSLGDGKERPTLGDGEKGPSSGDGKERPTLGDGKDRPSSRDGKERPASGESDVNANRPSSQHNSSDKNRPPSKFERVRKGKPLAEHGRRNEPLNRSPLGYGRHDKGMFYPGYNKKDNSDQYHLTNYKETRVLVKSGTGTGEQEVKLNAFRRDLDEVQTKDHIENKDLSKGSREGERHASRKVRERGWIIRDKSRGTQFREKSEVLTEDCDNKHGLHIENHVKENNHKISKHDLGAANKGRHGEDDNSFDQIDKVTVYTYGEVERGKTRTKFNQASDDRLQRQDSIHQKKPPGFVLKPPPGFSGQKEEGKIKPIQSPPGL